MKSKRNRLYVEMLWVSAVLASVALARVTEAASSLAMQTRQRVVQEDANGGWQIVYKTVTWEADKTAVIVVDMWNKHWCRGATDRVMEMAPRMNQFLKAARQKGVLIVHAPSSCMEAYEGHPARKRAQQAPSTELPDFLRKGNRQLASEEGIAWPVDQSDGGCDCEPKCAAGRPWTRQIGLLEIADEDAISDSGLEIGRLFASRGIENVIVLGVHTNMCVVARPFGLRNMARLGKNVVLVRDLTDTMYNSRMKPHVSHIRGTELVVEHIEKYICPSITSSSLLGGPSFCFQQDERPHVAFIVSDDHYNADKTLPLFAEELRSQHGCRCTVIHGEGTNHFPTMEELTTADVAVLYIRRLALPKAKLDMFRAYLDAGKPLVGMRTASHAFSLRGKPGPDGTDQWPEFDADVLGGNYHDHGPNDLGSDITIVPEAAGHPILKGIQPSSWHSVGSLYFTAPLREGATLLMNGTVENETHPVTWTHQYKTAPVVYTALGHPDDFNQPQFRKLLVNAIFWAMESKKQ